MQCVLIGFQYIPTLQILNKNYISCLGAKFTTLIGQLIYFPQY